jgi:glycerol-3-phosphate acyltransferase PlsY
MTSWVSILIGYALGCLQPGWLLARLLKGTDLRRVGSGSTGARNAGRVLGPVGFAVVLLADAGKAALALWVADRLHASSEIRALVLPAVVTGHIWPIPLRFRGGRGLATALGGWLYMDPRLLLAPAVVVLLLYATTRRFSQSFSLAVLAVPFGALALSSTIETIAGTGLVALLVVFAHRSYWMTVSQVSQGAVASQPGG